MNRATLLAYWQTRREEWGRLRALVDGQALCREFLHQLEQLWAEEDEEEMSLSDASDVTGYSEDHLRRLVRQQKLDAKRRGSRLFFRIADLPRKPTRVANTQATGYDPKADARRVAGRRTKGEETHGTQTVA